METETVNEVKQVTPTGCCPPFDPEPWDNKLVKWDAKMFIRDSVRTFFYMPLNFSKVMQRLSKKVEESGADAPEWICLSDHTSKWNMDVYMEVDKEVPDAHNVTFSGKYFSKVYEGPFKDMSKWHQDYKESTDKKGLKIKKIYTWYTTCPKCAKVYGKNYNVFIGEISA